jgi:site-specific DNA-methyltransferase (adenine-specific)
MKQNSRTPNKSTDVVLPLNHQFCQSHFNGSTLVHADCFDVFPFIEDKSIDAIICDLPYGTTQNKWDSILPLDLLWEQYNRILKENGTIVLFSSQPFTSALIMSNPKMFKYEWIWNKVVPTGHLNAKRMPMKVHENILVFYNKQPIYNRQFTDKPKEYQRPNRKLVKDAFYETKNYGDAKRGFAEDSDYTKTNPKTLIEFSNGNGYSKTGNHPTQKPIELMEYLVKTYTNEGDMVLDNTMGSGTTNLACIKLNRKSIGIEKEKQYYDVAVRRASEYCP